MFMTDAHVVFGTPVSGVTTTLGRPANGSSKITSDVTVSFFIGVISTFPAWILFALVLHTSREMNKNKLCSNYYTTVLNTKLFVDKDSTVNRVKFYTTENGFIMDVFDTPETYFRMAFSKAAMLISFQRYDGATFYTIFTK